MSDLGDAAAAGKYKIVKHLLEHGADVHAYGDEALRWSSSNGHTDIVKLLIGYGANVRAIDDCALRYASQNGHTDTVKLLLEHGANVCANNNYALRWASLNGHTDIVRLLEEYKEIKKEIIMKDKIKESAQTVYTFVKPYEKYVIAGCILIALDYFVFKGGLSDRIKDLASKVSDKLLGILDRGLEKIGGSDNEKG